MSIVSFGYSGNVTENEQKIRKIIKIGSMEMLDDKI